MNHFKSNIVLQNRTVEEILTSILGFQDRYTNFQFRQHKGIWDFRVIEHDETSCIIQVVDKFFEPPKVTVKGQPKSDAPYIIVKLRQVHESVHILYWLQWQKWKILLVASACCICVSFYVICLIYEVFSLLLSLFLTGGIVVFVRWIIGNIRHDKLSIDVFSNLLENNFT